MKAHIYTYTEPTISAGTVARTACLLLALTNQLLSALGQARAAHRERDGGAIGHGGHHEHCGTGGVVEE